MFADLGWDYDDAIKHVNALAGDTFDHRSHRSDHYAAFAAAARQRAGQVSHILEIGTSSGEFSVFLASLFRDAHITTIDLASDDPRFFNATTTDRAIDTTTLPAQVQARDQLLATRANITFRAVNSLALTLRGDPAYDLIWVDGDHTFPVVAIDLANALRLVRPGGLIICDDVARGPHSALTARKYGYRETEDTLEVLVSAGLASVSYVLKRTSPADNLDEHRTKYLAIVTPRPTDVP
jgi:predicted O-methyltransferase YrrM